MLQSWRRIYHHRALLKTQTTRRISTDNISFLTRVFDDDKYFRQWRKTPEPPKLPLHNSSDEQNHGLFRNSALTSPKGLVAFAKLQLQDAKRLAALLTSPDISRSDVVRKMDQLLDTLCRAIDVAEFIRVAHPGSRWVAAAQQTHEIMFEYMNQLNTNVELYSTLKAAMNDPATLKNYSEEETAVGNYLLKDFERSGIEMDDQTRAFFVEITQQILLCGAQYTSGSQQLDLYWCELSAEEWDSLSYDLRKLINRQAMKAGHVTGKSIPLTGTVAFEVLTQCSNPEVRRKVWIGLHSAPKEQVELLDGFLILRAVLARRLGFDSFALYQLEEKMARSPQGVMTFLNQLRAEIEPKVVKELRLLTGVMKTNKGDEFSGENKSSIAGPISKSQYLNESISDTNSVSDSESVFLAASSTTEASTRSEAGLSLSEADMSLISLVHPWDRDYLMNKYKSGLPELPDISPYLSIGTVISGLSSLFESIYNITLQPVKTVDGETWDDGKVRKIAVVDNSLSTTLGYLYLDFWSPKVLPSHFTIVCLREKANEEQEISKYVHLDETGSYQVPVIALLCNFSSNSNTSVNPFRFDKAANKTLLSLDQMETVFHEMGHAMHLMIGRTKLHNLAGTRCLTDFAELPLVLMEFFAKDPRVLGKILRHHETNEPIEVDMLAQHQKQRQLLDFTELYIQLKMATLDQVLHLGQTVIEAQQGSFDLTKVYHSVESSLEVFADSWSTWHGKFPHLFLYGAVYYLYLLDRAIAEKLWQGLFEKDPWSREAGEKYKNSILRWGGTKDPWEMLADALENEELRCGDERSMAIIATE